MFFLIVIVKKFLCWVRLVRFDYMIILDLIILIWGKSFFYFLGLVMCFFELREIGYL